MDHPRSILQRYGITAKKSLGQNFIHDDYLLARIADAAGLVQQDEVLEVGPGLGALTEFLIARAGRVVAVELDSRLLPVLEQRLGYAPGLEILQGDILDFDPAGHLQTGYKVLGNVPYYITGAILRHLLEASVKPKLLVLTVQHEVAERIVAAPGSMSMLSVMVQYYAQVELLFKLKAGSFWPQPTVDSAVIRLTLHEPPRLTAADETAFFRLVRTGFAQKRKQLQKNLRALGLPQAKLAQAMARSGIEGQRRAQSLSLEEWLALQSEIEDLA